MSYIITQAELEDMSITQLKALYQGILTELANRGLSAVDCPLTMVTLENIRIVLRRKQAYRPSMPRF